MTITYSEWHTLTVTLDGENHDGTPYLDYDLAHAESCPPATAPDPDSHHWPDPRCYLEHFIREWADEHAEDYGIPTKPGTYRARIWYQPGYWSGSYYCEPEDGIEIDEDQARATATSGRMTP